MRIDIPADVAKLVARQRDAELDAMDRRAAREEKQTRAKAHDHEAALAPARRILAFARSLAAELPLPPSGLPVFVAGRGRSTTRVRVLPDGTLALSDAVAPFGGACRKARTDSELADAPLALVRALDAAVESGAVWDHVRAHVDRCR